MILRAMFVAVLLLTTASARGQTYSNLDDSTAVDSGLPGGVGWGSCVDCAGGTGVGTIASSPFQTTPSVDGASRDFYINGTEYTDGLWWYKVGPNDAVSNFQLDFWVYFSNTKQAQAMEFDTFQFNGSNEYMFGTQCDNAYGTWDVWNAGGGKWVHTNFKCNQFQASKWYHVTLKFHRSTPDNYEHYDSITIQPAGSFLKSTYNFNLAYASEPLPPGWSENMGIQFQLDVGPTGTPLEAWVDEVTLTTH